MSEFLAVSMYMDEASARKYFTGVALDGIDNKHFPGNVVPFAPQSPGEVIALKKYARAHRAQYVKGPPAYLLTIKIPANFAVQHFLDQDIKVMDNRPEETVGFAKSVNQRNYPTMIPEVTAMDVQGAPEELLRAGYELLS